MLTFRPDCSISGGHLNPAVSAGFVATGRYICVPSRLPALDKSTTTHSRCLSLHRLGMRRFILYVSAQLLGACLGAAMLRVR